MSKSRSGDKMLARVPVYAAGLGLTALFLWLTLALNWSGLTTLLVGFAVAIYYTVFILVPLLILAP